MLRALVCCVVPEPLAFFDDEGFSRKKEDYPKWKDTEPSKQETVFEVTVELDKTRDVGFYQFVVTQLKLDEADSLLALQISVAYRGDKPEPYVVVRVGDASYSDLDAQQVLKKGPESSRSILFHNSTEQR